MISFLHISVYELKFDFSFISTLLVSDQFYTVFHFAGNFETLLVTSTSYFVRCRLETLCSLLALLPVLSRKAVQSACAGC